MASATDHLKWFGLIESKIRYFVQNFEKEECVDKTRIWPKPFTKRNEKTQANFTSRKDDEKTFKTSLEKPFSFYEKVNVAGCKFWGSS